MNAREQKVGKSESCTTSDTVLAAGLRRIGSADPIWVTRPSVCPSLYPFLSAFLTRHVRSFVRSFPPLRLGRRRYPVPVFVILSKGSPACATTTSSSPGRIALPHVQFDRVCPVEFVRRRGRENATGSISLGGISASVRIDEFNHSSVARKITPRTLISVRFSSDRPRSWDRIMPEMIL